MILSAESAAENAARIIGNEPGDYAIVVAVEPLCRSAKKEIGSNTMVFSEKSLCSSGNVSDIDFAIARKNVGLCRKHSLGFGGGVLASYCEKKGGTRGCVGFIVKKHRKKFAKYYVSLRAKDRIEEDCELLACYVCGKLLEGILDEESCYSRESSLSVVAV